MHSRAGGTESRKASSAMDDYFPSRHIGCNPERRPWCPRRCLRGGGFVRVPRAYLGQYPQRTNYRDRERVRPSRQRACSQGASVLAVDVLEACCDATACSALLNGVRGRVQVQQIEDLKDVRHERFDVIAANPPAEPVPPQYDYWAAGHGGVDGMHVVRDVIKFARERLADRGTIVLQLHSLGGPEGGWLGEELREVCAEEGWYGKLIEKNRVPAEVRASNSANRIVQLRGETSKRQAYANCLRHLASLDAQWQYGVAFVAQKNQTAGHGQMITEKCFDPWEMDASLRPTVGSTERPPALEVLAQATSQCIQINLRGLSEHQLEPYLELLVARSDHLRELLSRCTTIREATKHCFSSELAGDPMNASVLYCLVACFASKLRQFSAT